MEEYKETNDQILKKIPSKWALTKLKYVSALKTGGTPPDKFGISNEGDYPWITAQDMNDKLEINNFSQFISKEAINKCNYKLFPKDSVLLVCIASVGKLGILNRYAYANQQITAIIPNYMINPRYLLYYTDAYSEKISKDAANNVVPIINSKYLNNLTICLPTKYEQNNIADFLDKKVDKIDKILEDLNKQIEILNNYKKSIITETVTKGLNKNVEYKDSKIEWIGIIPTNWKITYNKYIMKKIKNIKESYENENILSLTTNGVIIRDKDYNSGKLPASYDGYQIVKKGNLLMCLFDIDVTPRCVGLIKNNGLTSPAYSQFELINGNIANYYYYYYLMVDNTKELLHLAKNLRHSLTETDFGSIKTIQPPIEEQIEISNYLDKKCKKIDKTIQIKKKQIDKLENYKKSLIYEYVTGKKRVKEE